MNYSKIPFEKRGIKFSTALQQRKKEIWHEDAIYTSLFKFVLEVLSLYIKVNKDNTACEEVY